MLVHIPNLHHLLSNQPTNKPTSCVCVIHTSANWFWGFYTSYYRRILISFLLLSSETNADDISHLFRSTNVTRINGNKLVLCLYLVNFVVLLCIYLFRAVISFGRARADSAELVFKLCITVETMCDKIKC